MNIMEAGYRVVGTGGGCEAWRKTFLDGTYLLITDADDGIDGDPREPIWLVGRYNNENGFILLDEHLTQTAAIRLGDKLRKPIGDEQVTITRADVEGDFGRYVRELGLAFHPDTRGAEYIRDDGSLYFDDAQAAEYDRVIAEYLGDAYGDAIAIWEEMGLSP